MSLIEGTVSWNRESLDLCSLSKNSISCYDWKEFSTCFYVELIEYSRNIPRKH